MRRTIVLLVLLTFGLAAVFGGGGGQAIEGLWTTRTGPPNLEDRSMLVIQRSDEGSYLFIWYHADQPDSHASGTLSYQPATEAYVGTDREGGSITVYVGQGFGYGRVLMIEYEALNITDWVVPLDEYLERN